MNNRNYTLKFYRVELPSQKYKRMRSFIHSIELTKEERDHLVKASKEIELSDILNHPETPFTIQNPQGEINTYIGQSTNIESTKQEINNLLIQFYLKNKNT